MAAALVQFLVIYHSQLWLKQHLYQSSPSPLSSATLDCPPLKRSGDLFKIQIKQSNSWKRKAKKKRKGNTQVAFQDIQQENKKKTTLA